MRHRRLSFLLVTLDLACRSSTLPQPPSDTSAPEVVEWLIGEQVRGPKTSKRGHVGVVIYDLSAAEPTATVLPNSCREELTRLIPTPDRSGTRFAIDKSGRLLRHSGAGWSAVPAPQPLPAIDELLAFSSSSSRLELLVRATGEQRELTLLTLEGGQVTSVDHVELATFHDRRETLQRYDSGRCLGGDRDCLHLVTVDGDVFLMREPVLFENHVEIELPLTLGARDVRYADNAGKKIDVLTTEACPADEGPAGVETTEPAALPAPSPEPEAVP